MATEHLIVLSIPGLRPGDVDKATTPTLYALADRGSLAQLAPTFPCVTSCVQASMWTGTGPGEHGVIANGFYNRDRAEVEFWVGRNGVIAGEQIFSAIRSGRRGLTSAVWHAQNIKDAAADFIVTPAPIHEADGTMKLWCYSKPDGLYQSLIDKLGHFPLQHYWGPLASIESTRWILRGAAWLNESHAPNLHWIYVPHLDYAAQKFGPGSTAAKAALVELDGELGRFVETVANSPVGRDVVYLVAGEYALTDVTGVVYPNRMLREAGMLAVREEADGEHVDLRASAAFAMVDHQLTHVYVDPSQRGAKEQCVDLFRSRPGIADVCVDDDRERIGLSHARSGDVILVAEDTHWFAYYWWLDDANAPAFARSVDIHRKPGYDPVELFVDPETKSIPLKAELIRGSHGVPATHPRHRSALICSAATGEVESGRLYRDTDVKRIVLNLLSG